MLDRFNRNINYLRISLTNECNFRCIYCYRKPSKSNDQSPTNLSLQQVKDIVNESSTLGISKIRFTGGEPLLRNDLSEIIHEISQLKEITTVAITTNGSFLYKKIDSLISSGLSSVNISLDTINPYKYSYITRGGNFFDVIRGLEKTLNYNIPIKINMVVINNININEIDSMKTFCNYYGIKLQLIKHYNINEPKQYDDSFDRPPKCSACNKIRILSDGKIKPCLHSQDEYKIDYSNIKSSLLRSILEKPENGSCASNRNMVEIGG